MSNKLISLIGNISIKKQLCRNLMKLKNKIDKTYNLILLNQGLQKNGAYYTKKLNSKLDSKQWIETVLIRADIGYNFISRDNFKPVIKKTEIEYTSEESGLVKLEGSSLLTLEISILEAITKLKKETIDDVSAFVDNMNDIQILNSAHVILEKYRHKVKRTSKDDDIIKFWNYLNKELKQVEVLYGAEWYE